MNMDATKTVTLTHTEWNIVMDAVSSYHDCGPTGEGWQSPLLSEVSAKLSKILDEPTSHI